MNNQFDSSPPSGREQESYVSDNQLAENRAATIWQATSDVQVGDASSIYFLSNETGANFDFVRRHYEALSQGYEERQFRQTLRSAPHLQSFVTHPENAALSRDSLSFLAQVERSFQAPQGVPDQTDYFGRYENDFLAGTLEVAHKTPQALWQGLRHSGYNIRHGSQLAVLEELRKDQIADSIYGNDDLYDYVEDFALGHLGDGWVTAAAFGRVAYNAAEFATNLLTPVALFNAASRLFGWGGERREQIDYNDPVFQRRVERIDGLAERQLQGLRDADAYYKAHRPQGETFVTNAILSGIESLGRSAPALVAGVATGGTGALLVSGLQAFSDSYAEGRVSGLGHEDGLSFGALNAVVELGTEKIPFGKLFDKSSKGLKRRLIDYLASDQIGEQIATHTQDAVKWQYLNPEKSLSDFLAERPAAAAATAIATLTAGAPSTLIMGAADKRRQIMEDARTLDMADRLSQAREAYGAAPLTQRTPEKAREFLETVTENERVWLDARAVRDLFQANPRQAARLLGEIGLTPSSLTQVAAGLDVSVPVASLIQSKNGFDVFLPMARPEPGLPTTQEIDRRNPDEHSAVSRDAEARRMANDRERASLQLIQSEFTAQQIEAGIPKADAVANSALYAAFLKAVATPEKDVESLHSSFGIRIQRRAGKEAPAVRLKDGRLFTIADIERLQRIASPENQDPGIVPLAAFVRQFGLDFDLATPEQAALIEEAGLTNRNSGATLEEAAERAANAGFIERNADGSVDLNAFLDRLSQDISAQSTGGDRVTISDPVTPAEASALLAEIEATSDPDSQIFYSDRDNPSGPEASIERFVSQTLIKLRDVESGKPLAHEIGHQILEFMSENEGQLEIASRFMEAYRKKYIHHSTKADKKKAKKLGKRSDQSERKAEDPKEAFADDVIEFVLTKTAVFENPRLNTLLGRVISQIWRVLRGKKDDIFKDRHLLDDFLDIESAMQAQRTPLAEAFSEIIRSNLPAGVFEGYNRSLENLEAARFKKLLSGLKRIDRTIGDGSTPEDRNSARQALYQKVDEDIRNGPETKRILKSIQNALERVVNAEADPANQVFPLGKKRLQAKADQVLDSMTLADLEASDNIAAAIHAAEARALQAIDGGDSRAAFEAIQLALLQREVQSRLEDQKEKFESLQERLDQLSEEKQGSNLNLDGMTYAQAKEAVELTEDVHFGRSSNTSAELEAARRAEIEELVYPFELDQSVLHQLVEWYAEDQALIDVQQGFDKRPHLPDSDNDPEIEAWRKLSFDRPDTANLTDEDKAHIRRLASEHNIGPKHNVAFIAALEIEGLQVGENSMDALFSVSGGKTKEKDGTFGQAGIRLMRKRQYFDLQQHGQSNPTYRATDAEVFLIEYLTTVFDALGINPSGKIVIVSELAVCDGCANLLAQFNVRFPNMEIIIRHGGENYVK